MATAAVLALACMIGDQAARLTWKIYYLQNDQGREQPLRSRGQSLKSGLNTEPSDSAAKHKIYTLFGSPKIIKAFVDSSAVDTKSRLNVKVSAIVYSAEADKSIAIIEKNGQQYSYSVNDKIDGTEAVISDILQDRVVITRRGTSEMLPFDMEITPRINGGQPNIESLGADLLKNPGDLMQYIAISPVKKDDNIEGYRLNPGPKKDLFKKSGLHAGDLAISINGFDLRDKEESANLIAGLHEQTQLSIVVVRDNAEEHLFIDLSDL